MANNNNGQRYGKNADMQWMSYYNDTGCDLSPSCLNCPFKKCKHDVMSKGRGTKSILKLIS